MGIGCLNFVAYADHFRPGKKMDGEVVSFQKRISLVSHAPMTLEHMI